MSVKKKNASNGAYYIAFIVYCVFMLWLLFGRRQYQFDGNFEEAIDALVNLRPLKTISAYLYVLENVADRRYYDRLRGVAAVCHAARQLRYR